MAALVFTDAYRSEHMVLRTTHIGVYLKRWIIDRFMRAALAMNSGD